MEAELRSNLLALAQAYAAARKLNIATVAQRALGDWRFFERLEESERASFTIRKYDIAVRWFSEQWPEDAAWPAEINRPGREAQGAAA